MSMANGATCLCGCGKLAEFRGLAIGCYRAARFQIKKAKATWAELEALGLALPAAAPGRKGADFLRKLAEVRAAAGESTPTRKPAARTPPKAQERNRAEDAEGTRRPPR